LDFATIGGLVFSIVAIAVGAVLEHVVFSSLLGESAFLTVVGGTIGATAMSHTMHELKNLPRAFGMALKPPKLDYHGMIEYLVGLAEKARRQGLLALQEDAEKATHPLVKRGLTLAVDGSDPEAVAEILESMSDMEAEEVVHASAVFDTAGGYSPTLGIMGTVMGLITVMGQLDKPETLGPAIAVAFLATLYGVAFANLLFLPLGAKVKAAVKEQSKFNEMLMLGVTGLQSGENPRNLREKLSVFAPHGAKSKGKGKAPKEGAAQVAEEGT